MTMFSARSGFVLPAVLFIAAFGILLGFGRLLVFYNQCKLRLDRQQEYEKVFAVRSAVNRLQNYSGNPSFPEEGGPDDLIAFRTDSGREIKVLIHPADAVFPILEQSSNEQSAEPTSKHFCVNRTTAAVEGFTQKVNYRYATSVTGDERPVFKTDLNTAAICLMPTNAVPSDKCRLSLNMSDTGRWSDDPFGRRYSFNVVSFCGTNEHDLVRLILRRKRTDEVFTCGMQPVAKDATDNSWKPAKEGESVIYAELKTSGQGGAFEAKTQRHNSLEKVLVSHVVTNDLSLAASEGQQVQNSFGIQLVGRQLTLFQASSGDTGVSKKYSFSGSAVIDEDVYCDFTNDSKTVLSDFSKDLVMELEVVASSSRNPVQMENFFGAAFDAQASEESLQNQFSHFEVYPAFEYAIYLENKNERLPSGYWPKPKLATIVHLETDPARNSGCKAITYDTHGTEISGWRTDERKAWGLVR